MSNATTVQAVSKALTTAGISAYKPARRNPEVPGVKVRGHFVKSRNGRGVVCVNCDQTAGDAEANARRVADALNAGQFVATFDPEHGARTGVVFVFAK